MQWQPDGLTIHAKMCFPGARFLGAPPISLTEPLPLGPSISFSCRRNTSPPLSVGRTLSLALNYDNDDSCDSHDREHNRNHVF